MADADVDRRGRHFWPVVLDPTAPVAGDQNQRAFLPVAIGPGYGVTTLVSVNPAGRAGNGRSTYGSSISADGRYVAFASEASDLVPGDTNGMGDIFVRDMQAGVTTRVSIMSGGGQGVETSMYPAISADGRFVAFQSAAAFVAGDEAYSWDIYLHDRLTGQTTMASVSTGGAQGNGDSLFPVISADGRFIAFESGATNLAGPDTNDRPEIYIRDQLTAQTSRLPIATEGTGDPDLSADGRYVAFVSFESDLVPNDTNGVSDAFVYDHLTGQIERVSVSSAGVQGNRSSHNVSISNDGRYVGFVSRSTTLAPDDEAEKDDMFVHDRVTGTTTRVTVKDDGSDIGPGNLYSTMIAGNGRFVVYEWGGIRIRDWQNNRTYIVFDPNLPLVGSTFPVISDDGRAVVFEARAAGPDPNDTNNAPDFYRHVRSTP